MSLDLFEPEAPTAIGSAILSGEHPTPLYRYRLERQTRLTEGATIAFIMVNPSTADAFANDMTISKVMEFSALAGAARVIVGNKFAYRATDIKALRSAVDPIGPDNDHHLEQIMRDADRHIVAWGPLSKLPPSLRNRWRDVVEIARRVGCPLQALATAQCGHPRHPCMLGYKHEPAVWSPPSASPALPQEDVRTSPSALGALNMER